MKETGREIASGGQIPVSAAGSLLPSSSRPRRLRAAGRIAVSLPPSPSLPRSVPALKCGHLRRGHRRVLRIPVGHLYGTAPGDGGRRRRRKPAICPDSEGDLVRVSTARSWTSIQQKLACIAMIQHKVIPLRHSDTQSIILLCI